MEGKLHRKLEGASCVTSVPKYARIVHKVGLWVHICTIRAYRVCRDQHHLDICSPRVDRGVFSLVGVVVERRGVVFFLVGATRDGCGWVNVCWGAGGWVLLFPTSRSFEYTSTKWRTLGVLLFSRTSRSIEYMSTKWLWVPSVASTPPRSSHSPSDLLRSCGCWSDVSGER